MFRPMHYHITTLLIKKYIASKIRQVESDIGLLSASKQYIKLESIYSNRLRSQLIKPQFGDCGGREYCEREILKSPAFLYLYSSRIVQIIVIQRST